MVACDNLSCKSSNIDTERCESEGLLGKASGPITRHEHSAEKSFLHRDPEGSFFVLSKVGSEKKKKKNSMKKNSMCSGIMK